MFEKKEEKEKERKRKKKEGGGQDGGNKGEVERRIYIDPNLRFVLFVGQVIAEEFALVDEYNEFQKEKKRVSGCEVLRGGGGPGYLHVCLVSLPTR